MMKQTFKQSLIAGLVVLLAAVVLVGCGSDDSTGTEVDPTEVVEPTEDPTEEVEEGLSMSDLVGTWGEGENMILFLSGDGSGTWLNVFENITHWDIVDGNVHFYLPEEMVGRFEVEFNGEILVLTSVTAGSVFEFERISYAVEEIPVHPLLSASTEEFQQAILDALNEADPYEFRELRGFPGEEEFIAALLELDRDTFRDIAGERDDRIISISVSRLDRVGNSVNQRDANDEDFTHWDFVYEFDEETGRLRINMRHHFDIEADMSGVTRENFDAITIGMSLDDVSDLLGSEGSVGVTSGNHEVRTWSREFGGGTTVIISIYFVDDHVTSISQIGW